jgi:hypothetical protein
MEQLGAPDDNPSLAFGACRRGRDREAIDRYAVMFVHALAVVYGIRGRHEHFVTGGP